MGTPQESPFPTRGSMPPRFIQRLRRQEQAYKQAFGSEPKFDPPPYPTYTPRPSISVSETGSYRSPPPQYSSLNRTASFQYERLALPPDSLVLVTGANGWQGLHVADQLLDRGYRVRGTVRDADKAIWTSKYFKDKYGPGRFTTAIVPDVVPRGSLYVAIRGCSAVVHCISVTDLSPDPTQVITPTIACALNALEAAAQENLVKRFVYTSSTVAAVSAGSATRSEVTSDSWNMPAFLEAWQPPPYEEERSWSVYASSKLQTEQAVWRWYSDHQPQFTLNTVLPGTLWGRILTPGDQAYRTSVKTLKLLYDGNAAATARIPPKSFVDVQDSALLHVAALILPDVKDRRIFATHQSYNINSLLSIMRELYPDRVLESDISDHGNDLTLFQEVGYAEELLRRMGRKGFTDLQESVRRCCEGFA